MMKMMDSLLGAGFAVGDAVVPHQCVCVCVCEATEERGSCARSSVSDLDQDKE